MRTTARGFTLVELVVVITILGILAAFAVPRFLSLDAQARAAATQGLAGSVRSASALSHSLWLALGTAPASITVDGQAIGMVNGYPNLASIDNTLQDTTGFAYDDTTGVFSKTGASGTCTVTYAESPAAGQSATVAVDVSGC